MSQKARATKKVAKVKSLIDGVDLMSGAELDLQCEKYGLEEGMTVAFMQDALKRYYEENGDSDDDAPPKKKKKLDDGSGSSSAGTTTTATATVASTGATSMLKVVSSSTISGSGVAGGSGTTCPRGGACPELDSLDCGSGDPPALLDFPKHVGGLRQLKLIFCATPRPFIATPDFIAEMKRQLQAPLLPPTTDTWVAHLYVITGSSGSGKTVRAVQLIDTARKGNAHSAALLFRGDTVFGSNDYSTYDPRQTCQATSDADVEKEWVAMRNEKTAVLVATELKRGLGLSDRDMFQQNTDCAVYLLIEQMGEYPQYLRALSCVDTRKMVSEAVGVAVHFVAAGRGCAVRPTKLKHVEDLSAFTPIFMDETPFISFAR